MRTPPRSGRARTSSVSDDSGRGGRTGSRHVCRRTRAQARERQPRDCGPWASREPANGRGPRTPACAVTCARPADDADLATPDEAIAGESHHGTHDRLEIASATNDGSGEQQTVARLAVGQSAHATDSTTRNPTHLLHHRGRRLYRYQRVRHRACVKQVMMTIHPLHAGNGYEYLTRQVALGDEVRRGESLAAYYTRGNPPGRWVGSGAAVMQVAGQVHAEQMRKPVRYRLAPEQRGRTARAAVHGPAGAARRPLPRRRRPRLRRVHGGARPGAEGGRRAGPTQVAGRYVVRARSARRRRAERFRGRQVPRPAGPR